MRHWFKKIILGAFILFFACSSSSNPLLEASDKEFIHMMELTGKHSYPMVCFDLLYNPEQKKPPLNFLGQPKPGSLPEDCLQYVRRQAKKFEIKTVIELSHITDPKVKERYYSIKDLKPQQRKSLLR